MFLIPLQVQELVAHLDNVREQLVAAAFFPAGSPDVELLTEMAVFGDAGCFLDKASCQSTQLHSCTYDAYVAPDPSCMIPTYFTATLCSYRMAARVVLPRGILK